MAARAVAGVSGEDSKEGHPSHCQQPLSIGHPCSLILTVARGLTWPPEAWPPPARFCLWTLTVHRRKSSQPRAREARLPGARQSAPVGAALAVPAGWQLRVPPGSAGWTVLGEEPRPLPKLGAEACPRAGGCLQARGLQISWPPRVATDTEKLSPRPRRSRWVDEHRSLNAPGVDRAQARSSRPRRTVFVVAL